MIKFLIAIVVVVGLSGCDRENKFQIIKGGKTVGYSHTPGASDSGCKWMSTEKENLQMNVRICGDFMIIIFVCVFS